MEAGLPGVSGHVTAVTWDTGTTSFPHVLLQGQGPAQTLHLHTMETTALGTVEMFIRRGLQTLFQWLKSNAEIFWLPLMQNLAQHLTENYRENVVLAKSFNLIKLLHFLISFISLRAFLP